jgi:hypothetical protein
VPLVLRGAGRDVCSCPEELQSHATSAVDVGVEAANVARMPSSARLSFSACRASPG